MVRIACFVLIDSRVFAVGSLMSVDSAIMYATIIRPRAAAWSGEKPASANSLAEKEKRLYEELKTASTFDPRSHLQ